MSTSRSCLERAVFPAGKLNNHGALNIRCLGRKFSSSNINPGQGSTEAHLEVLAEEEEEEEKEDISASSLALAL